MDRFWLLTTSAYGTWLPGDARGFVSERRGHDRRKILHNIPGTPYDADEVLLANYVAEHLKGQPIRIAVDQATALLKQFQETAAHRSWLLLAVAIMATHVHIVVGVPGDPKPGKILGDFKSYGSRALNQGWGEPASGTWWTQAGSKRKLPDEAAVLAAVRYVAHQEYPLLIWIAEQYRAEIG